MGQNVAKGFALWGISKGLSLPHGAIDRVSELMFLRRLLDQLQIDCVLDVGANQGQFASELRGIGYSGLIVSFEPVQEEFRILKERFRADPGWRGFSLALGSSTESKEIVISRLGVMSSLLEPINRRDVVRREMIEVRRLDSVLESELSDVQSSRIFLKMDTQGYDLEVFSGATGALDRVLGLQSELSVRPLYEGMPHYIQSLETYQSAGFDLYNLSVVNRIETGGLLELNCFMRRSGA
ncbi:FkbM family methyltransferase [Accumulibacter sp.]|uniref:FkbM family methyltransferase n=1 Tax=Accumulibacter sp. TaxID=2053492 RepID=UPI001AD1DF10|nr:FkbM family methyltransferase [Accumulibacter sp.]MBN8452474.1 FkbM family methyltransferase [Accumulibacter sp.]MBO3704821.1 FkbM family methyltransferase [Candidatus Accumulibacter conexus]